MDSCLCGKLSAGCAEVAQKLRAMAKIVRLLRNIKIALRQFTVILGGDYSFPDSGGMEG